MIAQIKRAEELHARVMLTRADAAQLDLIEVGLDRHAILSNMMTARRCQS
jgi:hypothetical protein